MNNDFSANASGNTAIQEGRSSSPFDQITALEAQEQARVQKEKDAMDAEEQQVKQALQEKDAQADVEMKDAARKELMEYRENDLGPIITSAEKDAQAKTKQLDANYEGKEKDLVNQLTNEFLAYNSEASA